MEKILVPGGRLELNEIVADKVKKPNTYLSQIYDIDEEENRVSIAMPYKEGRLVVLSMGMSFDAFFYSKTSLYHSRVKIVDRYKSNNLYVLVIELNTALKKVQRRQFFRYEVSMPVKYMLMDSDAIAVYEKTGELPDSVIEGKMIEGQTIDISGGGLKFAGVHIEKGSIVYIQFFYTLGSALYCLKTAATVVESVNPLGRRDIFHNRVSFDNVKDDDRELLIRFIFEEERKQRQNERRK